MVSIEIVLAQERVADVWNEAQPLLEEHWREIAHYQDIPLEPQRHAYFGLDAAGVLRVFTAREQGRLVGYAAFILAKHLHYASSLYATQDVLFLMPEYRNAGNGRALIAYCDEALRAEGVQVVCHHVKRAFDFGPLLASLDYEPVETLHLRRLDRGL